jgi:hypothetical protein
METITLTEIDALIEELCARRDPAALADLQEQLINRANSLESALWMLYRQSAA